MDALDPTRRRPDPVSPPPVTRGLVILAALAATTVAVAGMRAVSGILAPTFLALMLVIAVFPLQSWLTSRGLPGWTGALAAILAAYGIIIVLGLSLMASIAELARLLPGYQAEFQSVLDRTHTWLTTIGVGDDQIQQMLRAFNLDRLAGFATSLLTSLLSVLTNVFFIAALLLFFALDAIWLPSRLATVPPRRTPAVQALTEFARGTRRYLVVSTVFGLIVAAFDVVLLWALGIPVPLLWGLLAFITNYIPNVGFVLGVVPPALLGLLEGGFGTMLWVVIGYSVINVVIQSVIQPKVVGDQVGLSASVTFLSLVFWAWVLGPLGAILAVPLSLLSKAVLVDSDPQTAWLRPLISGHDDSPD